MGAVPGGALGRVTCGILAASVAVAGAPPVAAAVTWPAAPREASPGWGGAIAVGCFRLCAGATGWDSARPSRQTCSRELALLSRLGAGPARLGPQLSACLSRGDGRSGGAGEGLEEAGAWEGGAGIPGERGPGGGLNGTWACAVGRPLRHLALRGQRRSLDVGRSSPLSCESASRPGGGFPRGRGSLAGWGLGQACGAPGPLELFGRDRPVRSGRQ